MAAGNFLSLNTGTDSVRQTITTPGGVSYVLAYITDTGRLWFFDGVTLGGLELAMAADLSSPAISAESANFNAVAGGIYHCDPTSGAITATLAASPHSGDVVVVKDTTGQAASHNITVAGNGKNIEGASSLVIATAYGWAKLQFNGTQWVQMP